MCVWGQRGTGWGKDEFYLFLKPRPTPQSLSSLRRLVVIIEGKPVKTSVLWRALMFRPLQSPKGLGSGESLGHWDPRSYVVRIERRSTELDYGSRKFLICKKKKNRSGLILLVLIHVYTKLEGNPSHPMKGFFINQLILLRNSPLYTLPS